MSTPKPREWWIAETLGSWKVFADKAHAEFCMRGCGYTDAELAAELIHVIEYAQLAELQAKPATFIKLDETTEAFMQTHAAIEQMKLFQKDALILRQQLAEVTRERDELKRLHSIDSRLIKIRMLEAKAERFRGALEYIKTASKAQGFMFAHDEASKALTEAEGE